MPGTPRLRTIATAALALTAVTSLFVHAAAPLDDSREVRECSYALWYPWYVHNQARKPNDPAPPKPEPDGPRDPVGTRCIEELAAKRRAGGLPPLDAATITSLRGAAKAGKSAALFQAFDELKASRQRR